jgi:hypothetical protein
MMNRRFLARAFTGCFALLISANTLAATYWLRCFRCDSSQAPQIAEQSGLIGSVIVYSLANPFVAKFANQRQVVGVGCEAKGSDGTGKIGPINHVLAQPFGHCQNVAGATPVAPNAEEIELLRILQQLADNTDGEMNLRVDLDALEIPNFDVGNAHDYQNNVLAEAHTRKAVAQFLAAPGDPTQFSVRRLDPTSFATMMKILGSGRHIALRGHFHKITLVLMFPDQSTVTLIYNADGFVVSDEALSAESRDIMTPQNLSSFVGTRPLPMSNERSMKAFLQNAKRLGVRVDDSIGWGPGTVTRKVLCTADAPGHRATVTTCTVIK